VANRGHCELADIFRQHGAAYLATHGLTPSQVRAWRAIVTCRTPALGGHVEQCSNCGATRHVYYSCRNRHCPKCQTRAKEQWLAQRSREVLPVPYAHLVFTLPHALHVLASHHFRLINELLFQAAAATLTEFGANPRWLGGELALTLVLHTWSQNLMRHLHVHALVASGALTGDGQWVSSRRGFLFPVKALSKVFRGKFIAALANSHAAGKLNRWQDSSAVDWHSLRQALVRHDWVVYAKQSVAGPEQVLGYLARYTHKVAITNDRLIGLQQGQVTFRVRDNGHAGKTKIERLAAEAFIGRFLLHVLPAGFKRIRHYGILASCHKKDKLAACRAALAQPEPDRLVIESIAAFMHRVAAIDILRCPQCATGHFDVVAILLPTRWPAWSTGPPP
jgi:Putative transposase/Transposase zinc-binding domain